MSLERFLIPIIHGYSLHARNGSVLVSNELKHFLLPPAKESHFRVAINLGFLGVVELPRPSSIYYTTHPTGESHQRGLRLQATIGGASVGYIPRGIAFKKHGRVVML